MKPSFSSVRGHTLAETLTATALLVAVLTLSAAILNRARRGESTARESASLSTSRDNALSAFHAALETLTFERHPRFSEDGTSLEPASDQHFICGPARELLPETPGLSGDALFFPKQSIDGGTEATGFLVQYNDGRLWQPAALPNLQARWRFRLLQFRQPAAELTLYQTLARASPGLEFFSPPSLLTRQASCRWFAESLKHPGSGNCRVVAENIVALLIETSPASPQGWDTRRYTWDRDSNSSRLSQNRLPREITLHFLSTPETSWNRLHADEFQTLALQLQTLANISRTSPDLSAREVLKRLRDALAARSIPCDLATAVIPLPPGEL